MGDVIDFEDEKASRQPHLAASARCMNCGYMFSVVAPVGTVIFECPHCNMEKGVAEGFVHSGGLHAVCGCGCDLFRVTPEYVYCIQCGQRIGATCCEDD